MSHILIDHLTQAASFYRGQLRASTRAVAYLKARGLRGDIAARYGLGYAPAGFQALREAFPNYNDRALEKAGLVAVNDGGRRYDRFRDRLMFPIRNVKGECIGFGGRVFGDEKPKYLNSPETPVFHKGQELYGLYEARKKDRKSTRLNSSH